MLNTKIPGMDLHHFSESAPSAAADMTPSAELPAGKQPKKTKWNMSCESWVDADFSGAKNLHEKFSSSNIQRCKFIGSDLSGLLLKSNHVERCDFSNSDISNSRIQTSYLDNNLFNNCLLKETAFSGSYMKGCDFSGANFTEAEFTSGAFLNNTTAGALWHYTSFIKTQMENIVFEGTLEGCYFENCAFDMVTFQHATLINTCFKNKSLKWVRFIDCQADRMTYEFLKKNGQADLTGITLLTL